MVYEELGDIRPGYIDSAYQERFVKALSDDLDTPKALAVLWELVKDKNVSAKDKLATIHSFDSLLSLDLSKDPRSGRAALGVIAEDDIPGEVKSLLEERESARQGKDFARADELRDRIEELGFEVKDTADGQRLKRSSV